MHGFATEFMHNKFRSRIIMCNFSFLILLFLVIHGDYVSVSHLVLDMLFI